MKAKFGPPTSDSEQDINAVAVNNYNQRKMKPAHKH